MTDAAATPVVMVLARAENGVIGAAGDLPWRLPRDLKRYKKITMGCPMIMGRKTWDAIGRPLPGRQSIVVTRNKDFAAEGAETVTDLDTAFARAETIAAETGAPAIIIAGGAEIYRACEARADLIELTVVHMDAKGDTTLAAFPGAAWRLITSERHSAEADESADFSFLTYERDRLGTATRADPQSNASTEVDT